MYVTRCWTLSHRERFDLHRQASQFVGYIPHTFQCIAIVSLFFEIKYAAANHALYIHLTLYLPRTNGKLSHIILFIERLASDYIIIIIIISAQFQ